jgi:hypothetical protein
MPGPTRLAVPAGATHHVLLHTMSSEVSTPKQKHALSVTFQRRPLETEHGRLYR